MKQILLTLGIISTLVLVVLITTSSVTVSTTYPELRIERIDGCEYVKFRLSNAGGVVHHEACDNPKH